MHEVLQLMISMCCTSARTTYPDCRANKERKVKCKINDTSKPIIKKTKNEKKTKNNN